MPWTDMDILCGGSNLINYLTGNEQIFAFRNCQRSLKFRKLFKEMHPPNILMMMNIERISFLLYSLKNYLDLSSSQGENEPNNTRTDRVAGGQQRSRLHNDDKLNLIDTYLTQGLKRKLCHKEIDRRKQVYLKESVIDIRRNGL
uniref:Uncharacterized protein n=1 Tax=Glossina austeni TaxID=7395 RepID=A0A1A9V4U6_GLOAU